MKEPTLKQKEVLKRLPENGYNISKTSRLVGYTEQSSKAGSHYEALRKHIQDVYNPDTLKADIQAVRDKAMAKEDLTAVIRLLELQSRITGIIKPESTNQLQILGDDAIKGIVERANVKDNEKLDNSGSSKSL